MSPKLKIQFQKFAIITFIWLCLGAVIGISDHLVLNSEFSLGPTESYTFLKGMILNLSAAFIGAMLGASFLVFYINEKFRDKPYGYSILAVCIAFVVIVSLITSILSFSFALNEMGLGIKDPATIKRFWELYLNPGDLKNVLTWSIIVGMTQLLLHMNDKFGPGLLWDFIKGKYHSPREETRIFMFVDLKSSTSIAEKLGNEKYYHLLKDFFSDITDSIIYNKGQIYQYVGDEVVISWKVDQGVENDHCLKCYFDMLKAIRDKGDKYQDKYGLIPEFKAGLHYGKVTAGEIGIIKRDLTFSGDVLNTAARIQSECNTHKVGILMSDKLFDLLKLETYKQINLGAIMLRGKEEQVLLSTVEQI